MRVFWLSYPRRDNDLNIEKKKKTFCVREYLGQTFYHIIDTPQVYVGGIASAFLLTLGKTAYKIHTQGVLLLLYRLCILHF